MVDDLRGDDEGQLHSAAQSGNLGEAERLLREGYDVNAFDDAGNTPLHYAAAREDVDLVRFLLQNGADVNARDEATIGNTPLAQVAATCSLKMARLLLEAGADPRLRGWMNLCALDRAKNRRRGEGPAVYSLLLQAPKSRSRWSR
jgi:ankyrin repeat protein